jgi:hypothetical protein
MKLNLWITKKTVPFEGGFYDTYRLNGKDAHCNRIRFQNQDRAIVQAEKQRLEIEAANANDEAPRNTHLSNAQVREAEAAFQRLAKHPANLGERPLATAIDHFFITYFPPETDKTVSEIIPLFLADKSHRSKAYLMSLESDLTDFAKDYGSMKPHDILTKHAYVYMLGKSFIPRGAIEGTKARPIGPKRWNNLRGSLHAMFAWCEAPPRNWIGKNPFTKVDTKDILTPPPATLKPSQCLDLMIEVANYKSGVLVPYFALALFAGLRPAVPNGEIWKLAHHKDLLVLVNVDINKIDMLADIAKTKMRRQVTIQPALLAWLSEYWIEDFPVFPSNALNMIQEVRLSQKLGKDILRHTFISNYVGKFRNFADAAIEAGNTEAIIKSHYHNPSTKEEAELFWSITPDIVGKDELCAELRRKMVTLEGRKNGRPASANDTRMHEEHFAEIDAQEEMNETSANFAWANAIARPETA